LDPALGFRDSHDGQRYRTWPQVGNTTMSRDEALALLDGDKYDPGNIRTRMQYAHGYRGRESAVREPLVWEKPGQVGVLYDIVEQPPAAAGAITILGNEVTRENV